MLLTLRSKWPSEMGEHVRTSDLRAALLVLIPLMLAAGSLYRLLTAKSIILSERLIGRGGKMFVGYRFRILAANSQRASQWTRRLACIKS
jgi:lipopolysaccharide/colanic/teichoic acid biosynthesis glycosyltransferase